MSKLTFGTKLMCKSENAHLNGDNNIQKFHLGRYIAEEEIRCVFDDN